MLLTTLVNPNDLSMVIALKSHRRAAKVAEKIFILCDLCASAARFFGHQQRTPTRLSRLAFDDKRTKALASRHHFYHIDIDMRWQRGDPIRRFCNIHRR